MFDWLRLVAMSLTTGVRSAIATYQQGSLSPNGAGVVSPFLLTDWDTYESRLFRYMHHDLYYFNTVFSALESYATEHIKSEGLYKFTRGIYNPVHRLVNITASKCYGGNLDMEDMSSGPVPFTGLDRRTEEAIRQLWKWSNFGQLKMRYARTTARYGDGVIKVVDNPLKGRVRLEVLHPGVIREAVIDAVGYVKAVVIEYEVPDPLAATQGETCLYREVIDQERFATYRVKDGQAELYPWHADTYGIPTPEWANAYGFVPVVLAQASDIGRQWGAVTFHGGTLRKIDLLNDLASLTHDHIRQAVDAMWYIAGANSVNDLDQSDNVSDDDEQAERSEVPVLTGPEGSSATPMVAPIDFSGALEAMHDMIAEIENDNPELLFMRMTEFSNHSAPAVRTVLGPGIDRLTEFNGNVDTPLVRAHQMAMTIGGLGKYENFESFGIEDYANGNLDFQIKARDIVLDDPSFMDRMGLFKDTEAPPRWIWSELGKTEEEIAEAEAYIDTNARTVAGEVGRALIAAQGGSGNTNGKTANVATNEDADSETEEE